MPIEDYYHKIGSHDWGKSAISWEALEQVIHEARGHEEFLCQNHQIIVLAYHWDFYSLAMFCFAVIL